MLKEALSSPNLWTVPCCHGSPLHRLPGGEEEGVHFTPEENTCLHKRDPAVQASAQSGLLLTVLDLILSMRSNIFAKNSRKFRHFLLPGSDIC